MGGNWLQKAAIALPAGYFNGIDAALDTLRNDFAEAAQKVYDKWEQDEEGLDAELGSGGICDRIAEALTDVVYDQLAPRMGFNHIQVFEGSLDSHSYIFVVNPEAMDAAVVDIPWNVYETFLSGDSWRKTSGVTISPDDIVIEKIAYEQMADQVEERGDDAEVTASTIPGLDFRPPREKWPEAAGIEDLNSFEEIRRRYAEAGRHHCLRLRCGRCGLEETCRCTAPKKLEVGLCYDCSREIGKKMAKTAQWGDRPPAVPSGDLDDGPRDEARRQKPEPSTFDTRWQAVLTQLDLFLTGKKKNHYMTAEELLWDSEQAIYLSDGGYSRIMVWFEGWEPPHGPQIGISSVSTQEVKEKWFSPEAEPLKENLLSLMKQFLEETGYSQ